MYRYSPWDVEGRTWVKELGYGQLLMHLSSPPKLASPQAYFLLQLFDTRHILTSLTPLTATISSLSKDLQRPI
jgi:hypothetical protein